MPRRTSTFRLLLRLPGRPRPSPAAREGGAGRAGGGGSAKQRAQKQKRFDLFLVSWWLFVLYRAIRRNENTSKMRLGHSLGAYTLSTLIE